METNPVKIKLWDKGKGKMIPGRKINLIIDRIIILNGMIIQKEKENKL